MSAGTPADPGAAISIRGLSKTYEGGFQALKSIDLDIRRGEIFALLGPNGAGKTTLIGITCGIVNPSAGVVLRKVAGDLGALADDRTIRTRMAELMVEAKRQIMKET